MEIKVGCWIGSVRKKTKKKKKKHTSGMISWVGQDWLGWHSPWWALQSSLRWRRPWTLRAVSVSQLPLLPPFPQQPPPPSHSLYTYINKNEKKRVKYIYIYIYIYAPELLWIRNFCVILPEDHNHAKIKWCRYIKGETLK